MSDDDDDDANPNYYDYFDTATSGYVMRMFGEDLSAYAETLPPTSYTTAERDARTAWLNTARPGIVDHYLVVGQASARAQVTSAAVLLEERIVAPLLVTGTPSTRPKTQGRAERRFPASCGVWEGFRGEVNHFQPPTAGPQMIHHLSEAFFNSLKYTDECKDEESEKIFHRSHVLNYLRSAGLVDYRTDQKTASQGLPDYVLSSGGVEANDPPVIRALLEYKATHNLPLPMLSEDVVRRYNNGCAATRSNAAESSRDHQRVCKTLAQLFGYMALNECRFGVLTSGTRSYFCRINNAALAEVTDAWFVGEAGYLKAWAHFYHLSLDAGVFPAGAGSWFTDSNVPRGWRKETEEEEEGGGQGSAPTGTGPLLGENRGKRSRHSASRDPDVTFSRIDTAPLKSVKFLGSLGYGRNGCVFRARWEGEEVAVKQFDLGRPGGMDSFCKEIEGYELLRDEQGILIPKALFLTESVGGGVKYLGLQRGRDPTSEDDTSSWPEVLDALRSQYGFVHDDSDGRNGLIIIDSQGTERLVAIDLESHALTEKGRENLAKIKASSMG